MIAIKIDNKTLRVEEGTSVMKAARAAGIDVPHLCWHEELERFTSCMLCLVKDKSNGKLFPSCSTSATGGMDIVTDDEEIREARKTALELLLSEHVGDCEAPCRIACPAHMNIPLMNRLIAAGKMDEVLEVVMRDIALPAVLGRICPAPCEGACHRKTVDEPVAICLLKRFAGDAGAARLQVPEKPAGKKVAVIGAGPAGLAAAYYLQIRGIQVTLFDAEKNAGGQLRTRVPRDRLPLDVLDREIRNILKTGIDFQGGVKIDPVHFERLRKTFDACVVAAGTAENGSENFGLQMNTKGIEADRTTYQTSVENVFAVGNALRPSKLAVRSAGQGKEVAKSVEQYLHGQPLKGEPRLFNSRFGKLEKEEVPEYLKEAADTGRNYPRNGERTGFSNEEAAEEARRCLHCDCRAVDDCKLRIYSDVYGVSQRRFKTSGRRRITKLTPHASLIYEPQKCIKCGICVRLTEKIGEKFGFAYIGRGFDVAVGVPFQKGLEAALAKTAEKVAAECPTGAIALKEVKKND